MLEAFRLAVTYMTPVVVLSDSYLANSAEPWRIPDVATLPRHPVQFRTEADGFMPYLRDDDTLARPWAIPGTPGLEHRIGGLEKQDGKGNVSYLPENHQRMTDLRREKVARIAQEIAAGRAVRRRLGQAAGRRLGRHARRDHVGRRRGARRGTRRRERAPAPPESVRAESRRRAAPLREACSSRS